MACRLVCWPGGSGSGLQFLVAHGTEALSLPRRRQRAQLGHALRLAGRTHHPELGVVVHANQVRLVVARAVVPAAEALLAVAALVADMAGESLEAVAAEDVPVQEPVTLALPVAHGVEAALQLGDLRLVKEDALRQAGAVQLHRGHQIDLSLGRLCR
ncbi:conserved hypothetical protein [Stutzerimonas stutzeri A1501]|uniref:Uncharacterized protein n=1 Tax=Stutzerimonas stutzeri (strain A1501) TaxID=379731 RepID=A4VQG7_STUS1|nr:conserved hypothetical protein [Stutzerimonas stutzeri A1501]